MSIYLIVCNSRGDVERLYNADGTLAARYAYDSWGNVISVVDVSSKPITNQNAIGNVNPIGYRGYYLDSETGYYYLQSRYYNPQIGRFLNADLYCDTETGALGTNMFAYCENNPIMRFDSGGQFWDYVFDAAFVCWSIYDVVNNPSDWKKLGCFRSGRSSICSSSICSEWSRTNN
ncbi:MAG: hypothetical protein K2J35_05485 [Eubacterium sp.]|nr:hypothetical protein [Eubacterium sp.]